MNNSRLCGSRIVVEEARPKDSETKVVAGKNTSRFIQFFFCRFFFKIKNFIFGHFIKQQALFFM